ncbi:MAG: hypothetical protein WC749_06355 [Dehalococcoidia bacterium]
MAEAILSQAQIDVLIAKNASPKGTELSPEMEALLTKGSEAPSEGVFAKRIAENMSNSNIEAPVISAAAKKAAETTPSRNVASGGSVSLASSQSGTAPAMAVAQSATAVMGAAPNAFEPKKPEGVKTLWSKSVGGAALGQPIGGADVEQLLKPLQSSMDILAKRMERAEAAFGRVGALEKAVASHAQQPSQRSDKDSAKVLQLEREMANINSAIQKLTLNLQNITNMVKNGNRQIRDVNRGLKGTLGYDIHETFECEHCGSQGNVTALVRCSECGEEGWWGWWPSEE